MPRKRSRRCRRRPEPLLSRDASLRDDNSAHVDSCVNLPSDSFPQAPEPGPEVDYSDQIGQDRNHTGATTIEQYPQSQQGHHDAHTGDNSDDSPDDIGVVNGNVDGGLSDSDSDEDEDVFESFMNKKTLDIFEEGDSDDNSTQPGASSADEEEESEHENNLELHVSYSRLEHIEAAWKFVSKLKRQMRRAVFLGIISLYGKVRYTLEHYEHLVAMMRDGQKGESALVLPCVSTMRRFVFPRLLQHCFVKSSIESFPTKPGFVPYLPNESKLSCRQSEAVVVLPSSWAKTDICSLHVVRELACIESCRCHRRFGSSDLRVDSTSYVLNQDTVSQHPDTLWINHNGVPIPSSPGMSVKLHSSSSSAVTEMSRVTDGFHCEQVKYRGEICDSFNVEIVSTVHVRFSLESGVYLEEGISPSYLDDRSQVSYDSCLNHLRNMCRRDHQSIPTAANDHHEEECGPQTRRQRLRQERGSDRRVVGDCTYLVPSDHITIVRIGTGNQMGVFVSRFWVQRLDDERNFFLFLNQRQGNRSTSSFITVTTIGAPVFVRDSVSHSAPSGRGSTDNQCRTTGTLDDGRRYYMYRLILYADDFTPRSTLFPKGSAGGVYMSPASLHIRSKRSQSSIRTISLTPPGVSTNSVIEHLIDDLVRGSTVGFECIDAFGKLVKVYFDIVGFIGDYPASSAVVDLKGHTATAPCTHCGFVFNKSSGSSVYAYTTSVSCCNSAFRRSQARTDSLRSLGLSTFHHKCLGMSEINSAQYINSGTCPLLKFASVYNTSLQNDEISAHFQLFRRDGYSLNLVAPDHLLSGLFKGVLTIVFIQLPGNDERSKVEVCLKAALKEFGFQSQSAFFKPKKAKLVPGLSMSNLFCILTVLPPILEGLGVLDKLPSKGMLINIYRLFTLAFWWPTLEHDGESAWRFVHGSGMKTYHRALQILAANFVKSVDKFGKLYPYLACHVDRPNVHRLLELFHHTVPLLNHITYFCELVFESSHQPLKFFLSRNHTLNSHVYAVQLILAKDWLIRVRSLWRITKNENEEEHIRKLAMIGLIRFLGGTDMDKIDWNSSDLNPHFNELQQHINTLMVGTVEKRLDKWYHDSLTMYNSEPSWILHRYSKQHQFTDPQRYFFSQVLAELSTLCVEPRSNFKVYHKALLQRGGGINARSTHERLHIGDVLQVLLDKGFEQNKFISTYVSCSGLPSFFVVCAFISSKSGARFAVVKQCTISSSNSIGQLPDVNGSPFIEVRAPKVYGELVNGNGLTMDYHFIEMTYHIRKVGIMLNHKTDRSCQFDTEMKTLHHSRTTLNGGRFFILTKAKGYPPRRS